MDLSMHRGGYGGKSAREKTLADYCRASCLCAARIRGSIDRLKIFSPGLARGACGHSRNSSTPRRISLKEVSLPPPLFRSIAAEIFADSFVGNELP